MKQTISLCLAGLLSGCAGSYGGRVEQGSFSVESADRSMLVYLMRNRDYDRLIAPRLATGGAVDAFVARRWSGIPAQGQAVVHEAGNFMMVYFCGGIARTLPVQVVPATSGKSNRYALDCARPARR